MEYLESLLFKAEGGPIPYYGKQVCIGQKIPVGDGQMLEAEFVKYNEDYDQGFEVSLDRMKGKIKVADQEIEIAVFWIDTAPKSFRFMCHARKDSGVLVVNNVWKNKLTGATDSGMRNAGLYVEKPKDNTYEFHCSCGLGPVDFNDLVFRLTLI